ncbi:MAG TPA: YetF domain-containing protein [Rhodanobacteraceae bacterium]|nr:YetF domain-containing protein [Rhodanobacteraceae bacterium]
MHDMFDLAMPAWELALRAAIVYAVLLILLRLSGKRTLGELSVFDLIVVIVLGSAVRTSMIGNDKSLIGGLIVVAVLLLLDYIIAWLAARFRPFAHALQGRPVLIARDGVVFSDVLKKCNIPPGAFDAALRKQSISTEQIGQAILEASGSITICKRG